MSELNENVLIRDRVKVEWVELGEGVCGDYDEENPEDVELLRFDVSFLLNPDDDPTQYSNSYVEEEPGVVWIDPGDASYCTQVPVSSTPEQRKALLEIIMDEVYEPLMDGHSVKKICERLSWIDLDWLKGENSDNS